MKHRHQSFAVASRKRFLSVREQTAWCTDLRILWVLSRMRGIRERMSVCGWSIEYHALPACRCNTQPTCFVLQKLVESFLKRAFQFVTISFYITWKGFKIATGRHQHSIIGVSVPDPISHCLNNAQWRTRVKKLVQDSWIIWSDMILLKKIWFFAEVFLKSNFQSWRTIMISMLILKTLLQNFHSPRD